MVSFPRVSRGIGGLLLAATATLTLSACTTMDGYGYDDGYYNDGYYNNGYSSSPYYGYGYGTGMGYGWYDDFYYPGRGYYVYDRSGKRQRWNNNQRRYWAERRNQQQSGNPQQSGRPSRWQNRPDPSNPNMTDVERRAQREAWRNQRNQQGNRAPPSPAIIRERERMRGSASPGQEMRSRPSPSTSAPRSDSPRPDRGSGDRRPRW